MASWGRWFFVFKSDCLITSPGWMRDKCLDLAHWEDPEGSGGEGGGRGVSGWGIHVYPWLIHVNVWQKPLQYCKVISLQIIKKKVKKKKKEWLSPDWSLLCEGKSVSSWVTWSVGWWQWWSVGLWISTSCSYPKLSNQMLASWQFWGLAFQTTQ